MLARLARWLRAAGYDAEIGSRGAADRSLIDRCRAEGRVLVTRDRRLAAVAGDTVEALWLSTDKLDEQAICLREKLKIDWTAAPFTRCLVDNTPLAMADEDDRNLVPLQSRSYPGPIRKCLRCDRIYWLGGHTQRILARLMRWRSLPFGTE